MRAFWIVFAVVIAAPLWGQTRTFEVVDRQGFDEQIVAMTMEIPETWKATREVLWSKLCSGNPLYEITLTISSPDGLTGARMLPGHQIIWSHHEMAGDPGMAQLWQSQQEAERNRLRTEFQGSNCYLAPLRDAQVLFRNLVLAKRPADTQVTSTKPIQPVLDSYKQIFAQPAPGSQVFFDANTHEMNYKMGNTPITERVNFSWYMFQTETRDPGYYMLTQRTIVDPIQIDWFPVARAQTAIATLDQIGKSIRYKEDWQKKVTEVREKRAKKTKEENEKIARERKRELKDRERRSDKRHRDFLRQIWQ